MKIYRFDFWNDYTHTIESITINASNEKEAKNTFFRLKRCKYIQCSNITAL